MLAEKGDAITHFNTIDGIEGWNPPSDNFLVG